MFANLKKIYKQLSKEDKLELRKELGYDNTRISKKINGTYPNKNNPKKEQFDDYEKEIIMDYLNNVLEMNVDPNYVFEETEKKKIEGAYHNLKTPTRLRICVKRAKDLYDITENEIASKLNISKTTLRNYKIGYTDIPNSLINDLAKACNVIPQYITGEKDIPLPYKYVNSEAEYLETTRFYEDLKKHIINRVNQLYKVEENDVLNYKFLLDLCVEDCFDYIINQSLIYYFSQKTENIFNLYDIFSRDNLKLYDKKIKSKADILKYVNANDSSNMNEYAAWVLEDRKNKEWLSKSLSELELINEVLGYNFTEEKYESLTNDLKKSLLKQAKNFLKY